MENSSFLRRTLRQIPDFRSLPAHDLDAVLQRMTVKEYQTGQVLWRTERRLNFLGVIKEGEIALEHRSYGITTYIGRRSNGDLVDPNCWKPRPKHMSIARALTDVKVYIISREAPARSIFGATGLHVPFSARLPEILPSFLIMLVVLFFGFADIQRIISDALILTTQQQLDLPIRSSEQANLLGFAGDLDPGSSFVINQQGSFLFHTGDLTRAGDLFTAAVNVNPTNGAALNNLAVTYFAIGQTEQAIQVQQQAVLHDPNNAQVLDNLGIMLNKIGRENEALRAFKEASFIQSEWALPFTHQALLYLQMQKYQEAEAAIAKAIKLEPEQQASYLIMAITLYEQERDQEAIVALDTSLSLSPDQKIATFYKALILGRQGKKEEALYLLNQLYQSTYDPFDRSRIAREIRFLESQYQTSLTQ